DLLKSDERTSRSWIENLAHVLSAPVFPQVSPGTLTPVASPAGFEQAADFYLGAFAESENRNGVVQRKNVVFAKSRGPDGVLLFIRSRTRRLPVWCSGYGQQLLFHRSQWLGFQ